MKHCWGKPQRLPREQHPQVATAFPIRKSVRGSSAQPLPSVSQRDLKVAFVTHNDKVFVNNNLSNIIETRMTAVKVQQNMVDNWPYTGYGSRSSTRPPVRYTVPV